VRQDIETDEEQIGFRKSEVCASCDWQSEPEFASFHDHIEEPMWPATVPAQASGCQTGSIRDAGNTESREVLESVPHRADGGSAGRGLCPCHVSAG
jgi:hypothetical protein